MYTWDIPICIGSALTNWQPKRKGKQSKRLFASQLDKVCLAYIEGEGERACVGWYKQPTQLHSLGKLINDSLLAKALLGARIYRWHCRL